MYVRPDFRSIGATPAYAQATPVPTLTPDCDDCKGVTQMVLEYTGLGIVTVQAVHKDDVIVTFFNVSAGDLLTIDGFRWKDGELVLGAETKIKIVQTGVEEKIHTSCSRPIDIGDVHGDFEISDLTTLPDCKCHGITRMILKYAGDTASDPVTVQALHKNDVIATFAGVSAGDLLTIDGFKRSKQGPLKLGAATKIRRIDPVTETIIDEVEFHTSCSQSIEIGDVRGRFEIYDLTKML